jgi:flavin reductase (DIM6/NTAB) family NADH-FMN oxidoreductase RutF
LLEVDFKLIHRLFYPQVPAVLSTSHRGRTSAMPVVSYASISDSPPLVAIACNPDAFTCKLALKSRAFSLSMVPNSELKGVERLAKVRGSSVKDKLLAVGLPHHKGAKLPVPILEKAEATLECKLQRIVKTGDHLLLIGRVVAAYATASFSDFWDFSRYSPILYTGWKDGMTTYPEPSKT